MRTKGDLVGASSEMTEDGGARASPPASAAEAPPAVPFKENLSCPPSPFSIDLSVSALTGAGLEELRAEMAARLFLVEADGELLVLERHREALVSGAALLREAAELARRPPGEPELVAARVREALTTLGAITGETATEELLDRIFAAFCVGK